MPNLPGLFYFAPGPLHRVDHVGTSKPEDNSLWELNMEPNLVRSQMGSSVFPSSFDTELPDFMGHRGMVNSLFAMLGCAMVVSGRLMDATVDNNEIQSFKAQVERLWR